MQVKANSQTKYYFSNKDPAMQRLRDGVSLIVVSLKMAS